MKDRDEIKELFQKELGNYQAKVNPNLWNGIQAGIGSAGAAGVASSMALSTKLIIGVSIVSALSLGTILLVNNNKEVTPATKKTELLTQEDTVQKEEIIKDEVDVINSTETTSQPIQNTEQLGQKEQKNEIDFVPEVEKSTEEFTNSLQNTHENEKTSNFSSPNIEKTTKTNSSNAVISAVPEKAPEHELVLAKIEIESTKKDNQVISFNVKNLPKGAEVTWDFGDGSYDYIADARHYYYESGDYEVILSVRHDGQEIIKSERISIQIKGEIGELPNVFTPNGDGKNDELFIETKHLKSFQLTVMDNNKNVVYSTQDPNFRWNGTDKYGMPVKDGNYIYIIIAEDEAGNAVNKYQQLSIYR